VFKSLYSTLKQVVLGAEVTQISWPAGATSGVQVTPQSSNDAGALNSTSWPNVVNDSALLEHRLHLHLRLPVTICRRQQQHVDAANAYSGNDSGCLCVDLTGIVDALVSQGKVSLLVCRFWSCSSLAAGVCCP